LSGNYKRVNTFHTPREVPQLETSDLDLFIFEICERNVLRHLWTVKANYSWLSNNRNYTLPWKFTNRKFH